MTEVRLIELNEKRAELHMAYAFYDFLYHYSDVYHDTDEIRIPKLSNELAERLLPVVEQYAYELAEQFEKM